MNLSLRRGVGSLLLLSTLTLSTTNCGIILHPDRSGRRSGPVDVVAIVLDCCWLLVGVVPGVVALVVDFTTGGMYGMLHHLMPGDSFGLNFKGKAPAAADVAITLTSPDGTVQNLARNHVEKGESTDTTPVTLPAHMAPGRYKVAISVNGRENANWGLQIQ